MKHIKYYVVLLLSTVIVLAPVAGIAASVLLYQQGNKSTFWIPAAIGLVCLILVEPIRDLRVKYRRSVEYDEYGNSKSKGRYEYLSKAERDAIDLQKTAVMETLVSTPAIKKMTATGPDNPMKALEQMTGLDSVKSAVREMVARMEFERQEKRKKKDNAFFGRHMVFYGPPGTGKTTVARIMASFLQEYGYIKHNKCLEVDGNFLKAGTDSAMKTEMVIRHAFDGVLFIDEAYALLDSSDGSGEQVIATLIKQMEDNRGKFILILAGYTDQMRQLIEANPGLESRIKDYLDFPNYSNDEMWEIFKSMAKQRGFSALEESKQKYVDIVERERGLRSFGNGRTARNILDKVIDKHALNIVNGTLTNDHRYDLSPCDFQNIRLGTVTIPKF